MEINMLSLDDFHFAGKAVLLRIDINSPIDQQTGQIANDNRIRKSLPTIRRLLDAGARLALIASWNRRKTVRALARFFEPFCLRVRARLKTRRRDMSR